MDKLGAALEAQVTSQVGWHVGESSHCLLALQAVQGRTGLNYVLSNSRHGPVTVTVTLRRDQMLNLKPAPGGFYSDAKELVLEKCEVKKYRGPTNKLLAKVEPTTSSTLPACRLLLKDCAS